MVRDRGSLRDAKLFANTPGEVLVVGFPLAGLRVEEDEALELGEHLGLRQTEQGADVVQIDPTAFGERDE